MKCDWKNKSRDLKTAQDILSKYYDDEDDVRIDLADLAIMKIPNIPVRRANWVMELEEVFEKEYGYREGANVLKKVMTEIITSGHTLH